VRRSAAALLAVLALLSGCSAPPAGNPQAQGPPSWVLGALYPLSGPQGDGGREELSGVQLAVAMVNAQGGVDGHLIALDVRSAPSVAEAKAQARSLMADHRQIVLGTYGSVLAIPAAEVVSPAGATYWETGAVTDALTVPQRTHVFRVAPDGGSLGRLAADFVAQVVAPRLGVPPSRLTVIELYENDVYGRSVGLGGIAESRALGMTVVDVLPYDAARADFVELARRIKSEHPRILLTASYLQDALAFRDASRQVGLHVDAAVGTSSAYCLPAFARTLGSRAIGLFAADKPDHGINQSGLRPEARALLERAQREYARRHGGRSMGMSAMGG
jgi:branched-chain amino acid transport system substrate-binding protein